jgi:hypothetical protein
MNEVSDNSLGPNDIDQADILSELDLATLTRPQDTVASFITSHGSVYTYDNDGAHN